MNGENAWGTQLSKQEEKQSFFAIHLLRCGHFNKCGNSCLLGMPSIFMNH